MKSYILTFSLMLVSLAPRAGAQFESRKHVSLAGQVEARGPSSGLVVVLSAGAYGDHRADVGPGGAFYFHELPLGQYELKVTDLYGSVIHREFVSVDSMNNQILVRVPQKEMEQSASGTVSAARLQRKIPSKARKEFEKGLAAADKNDSAAAIGHLAKAVELDPDYMEAHNNLGVQHLKCDANETALAEFQKAMELDPGAVSARVNLALTLLRMDRPAEAETAARGAVRLNGTNEKARYCLGLALLKQRKNTAEALQNLQHASEAIPRARLAIAETLAKGGDVTQARKELQAYLKSGNTPDRKDVEAWLAELK